MSSDGVTTLDPHIWKRQFRRGTIPGTHEPEPDIDTIADEAFQKENFVDHFGHLLSTDPEFRKHNTYNSLCSSFWESPDFILQTYCVADGQTIPKEQQKEWFRSELRFISLVLPVDANHPKNTVAPISSVSWAPWFWLIASSSSIYSTKDILHVMSWSMEDGQFRYYARDLLNNDPYGTRGWVYLCSSEDAFKEDTQYMGPLNGHVNGGLVMKELHKPWLHWLVAGRAMFELMPEPLYKSLAAPTWLTAPGFPPLYGGSVKTAENLEQIILDSLREWFVKRKQRDFFLKDGSASESPLNIQRWAAHFLLSTNVNIAAAPNAQPIIPYDFFFNYEMLRVYSDLLPNSVQLTKAWQDSHPCPEDFLRKNGLDSGLDWSSQYSISAVTYDPRSYLHNARELKICTMQEVPPKTKNSVYMGADKMSGGLFMGTLGDGNEEIEGRTAIYFAVTQWGEGESPWVILQPSVEDAMGVWTSQKMFLGPDKGRARCRIFSDETFNAMMMVDFWNPVFSWRRLRLMQYIPTQTQLSEPTRDNVVGEDVYTYTLEAQFITAIKKSAAAKDPSTPEFQFLDNLDNKSIFDHQLRIANYMGKVATNCVSADNLKWYMRLAESRRRMFRPLPMNFFGSNLPYCLGIDPSAPWLEMTEQGTVQPIPDIGMGYLSSWLGSLAGFSPNLLPPTITATTTSPDPFSPLSLVDNGVPRSVPEPEIKERIKAHKPALPIAALPKPSTMRMACQASISMTNPRPIPVKGGCPYILRKSYGQSGERVANVGTSNAPAWTDDVQKLFTEPSWPKTRTSKEVGDDWIGAMLYYGPLDLSNYSQVKEQVVVIYRHLRSRSMPITKYEDEYWPDWALDVLRNWANTGCRRAQTDPIVRKEIIPASPDPPVKFRVRKDVMSMTEEEINEYRMKLDDVLGAREKDSRWQELGWLHAQWCLHYQEATFFWHRAMLVYMEGLIDFPIPFWNGFAKESANPESAFAGIPNVFLEDEYFHPIAKEWRKNPLKYALACNPQGSDPSPVKRDSILENGKSTTDNTAWAKKIKDLMTLYHEQIKNALDTSTYSWPQETGFPWANLPAFKENMPDSDYAHRTTFDGIFEQPHDNMHGWLGGIGGDMSDNTKTGFDPLFYSMHANFDRIVAAWQSQHPNQTYSSNFPLRPFTDGAKVLSYEESRQYMFTTLGDMAKDTRTMGYIYAPPASPDAAPLRTQAFGPKAVSQGGHAVVTSAKLMAAKGVKVKGDVESVKVPYVVFEDVRCTTESYQINVYLDEGSEATFIGQSTRLGMGQGDIRNGGLKNRQRCEKSTITRAIEVKQFAKQLEEDGGRIRLEVRNLSTGNKVSEEEAARLKGFQARVVWM